jgi:hypothetical protein
MMSLGGWLNSTRFVGLAAYLLAAACCAIAWARSRKTPHRSQLAAALAVFEAGLFLDIAFNTRWQLHDLLEREAIRKNLYAQRTAPQLAALGLLGVAAAVGMGLALRYLRGRPGATIAAWGAILSLSLWCAEVVSLHATDAVLHHPVGAIMLVSLCWVICSLMTGLGILWDARAARSHDSRGAKPPSSLTNS